MWVRARFPSRGERLAKLFGSGRHPHLFVTVFLLTLVAVAALRAAGTPVPFISAERPLTEVLRTQWYVLLVYGVALGLVAQALAFIVTTLRRRRSVALRVCPSCGRVYPRTRGRCESCGTRLADAENFTWKEPDIPVPPKSDFTGESPFD
jgi:hypothetical protein